MARQRTWTSAALLTLALLVVASALGACGMAPPSMGYQGVLTNPQGTPVANGTYDMEFRLIETRPNAQLTPEPIQVFSQTEPVAVDGGLFNVVLGSFDNRLPVDRMGREMHVEIIVNGETLSPRQPLLGAPYAFSLYPGAVIYDGTYDESFAALTIQKGLATGGTPMPALRLEGALESTMQSHIWTPATFGHSSAPGAALNVARGESSLVVLSSAAAGVVRTFTIPILVPEVLYGQGVTLDSVEILYQCAPAVTCAADKTRISATYVARMSTAGGTEVIINDPTPRYSNATAGSRYTVSGLDYALDEGSLGLPFVTFGLVFHDTDDVIIIWGVRATYRHN